MQHPLEKRVQAIGRLARWQLLLLGASCVAGVLLAAGFAAGLTDFLFRFEDVGLRLMLSAAVLIAGAAGGYWFLWPALRFRRNDVQLAQRIERRYPQLHGRLSSALAFLKQSAEDPTAGSPALRRAVVAEASALTDQIDMSGAVNLAWGRWSVVLLMNLARVLLLVAMLDPSSSGLAAMRLAMPWNNQLAWPRRSDLAFVNPPRRIAAGGDFEVTLVDRHGRMPKEVVFQYWYDDDGSDTLHTQRLSPVGGQATMRLTNVRRPFNYRAIGGDHQNMPWLALAVVEPPRIEALEVRLVPPVYAGQAERVSVPEIRALEGTRVAITGRATRAVQSTWLRMEDEETPRAQAVIGDDGRQFTFAADAASAWTLDRSGNYWIEFVDREGLHTGGDTRWQATAVADEPPEVVVERPAPTTNVTRQAIVPISAIVEDDLAVHLIELRYRRSDLSEQGDQVIHLYAGPESVSADDPGDGETVGGEADHRPVEHTWDLAQLEGLQPGVTIEFQIAAADYKPQFGQSSLRRLVIISDEDLENQIARRRAAILNRLSETLQLQRDTRSQTKSLEIQAGETGRFTSRDVDQLQAAELVQRQARERLIGETDSVRSEVEGLLDDLKNNRVDSPDVDRRMREVLAVVARLGDRDMPQIEHQLVSALKISRTALFEADPGCDDAGVTDDSEEAEADQATTPATHGEAAMILAEAGRGQDAVIAELESLLGELSQWDNYRRFTREISRIRQDQDAAAKETEQLRITTLGKSHDELTPQQRADLHKLGERQLELARRFDATLARMRQMRDELAEQDPLASETLGDALDTVRRLAIAGEMHQSGTTIDDNRLGEAVAMQRDVLEGLREVLDVLSNRREHELGRLVEQLQKAQDELDGLRKQQQELTEELRKAEQLADPAKRSEELMRLSKQQQKLAEEIERLSRRLMRMRADTPAESLQRGAAQGQDAAASAGEGNGKQAGDESEDTLETLEKAAEELAQELAQAEQDLAEEQLIRLEQEIRGLILRQQRMIDDAQRLDALALSQRGGLNREQLQSLIDLARQQRQLGVDTGAIGARMAAAEAFQLGLRGAAREMLRASAALDRRETGESTRNTQQVALARLEQIVTALAPEEGGPEAESPDAGGGAGQQPGGMPPADATILAELKLLRLMQEEINRRTSEIETERDAGRITPETEQELLELAAEQGRLADLMLNLSRPSVENPEDDPAGLPEIPTEQKQDAAPKQEAGEKGAENKGAEGKGDTDPLDSLLPGGGAKEDQP